jgi:diacylglycerol kinase family enzyme
VRDTSEPKTSEATTREFGQYDLAVVLNENAKKVTPAVRAHIHDLVPERNIFCSRSLEDSGRIAKTIVEAGYDAVFTGGGDGTVIQFFNDLVNTGATEFPAVGVFPLGTGNAVAEMVSSGSYLDDLESYVLRKQVDYQRLGLLESEGQVFPFAGLGFDAGILNDYMLLKQSLAANRVMKPVLQSVGGYLIATFGKTIPRTVAQSLTGTRPIVRLTNLGDRAFDVDVDGTPIREFAKGDLIYEGPTIMLSAATAPYFGYALKIFPNSLRHPGFFEMRVVYGSVPRMVANLGKIWRGNYVTDDTRSVMATHVLAEFDRETPFQIGGDGQGYRRAVEFRLSPAELKLLRFI